MMSLFHLFTFILLLFNFSVAPEPKAQPVAIKSVHLLRDDDEFVSWSAIRKLTWEDFKSDPKKNMDAVALASTALGISYRVTNNILTFEINCSFAKQRSWGLLKTPYILAHEQGHFDITEIYARKLHKRMEEYHFNKKTFRQDINRIYDEIVKEKEAFQEKYDRETDHSRKKGRQEEWLYVIEDLLVETDLYADYP